MSSRLLTAAGAPLRTPTGPFATGRGYLLDTFERGAAGRVVPLENGWMDLADARPESYDSAGILDGKVVCRQLSRDTRGLGYFRNPANYAGSQNYISQPTAPIPGIFGAARDMGSPFVDLTLTWSGNWGPVAGAHSEATALLNVRPGTTTVGWGAWTGYFPLPNGTYVPVLYAGTIGGPPELFNTLDTAVFAHTHGTERVVRYVCDASGLRVWIDGVQQSFLAAGLGAIPTPPSLAGSTYHGFACDQHVVNYVGGQASLANMQAAPCITQIELTAT